MLNHGYFGLGLVGLALFSFFTLTGQEFFSPARQRVPAETRHNRAGYRSIFIWHSTYHGGK